VMGKPDAPVTIIEDASMGCPACARFHVTIFPKLKEKYIDSGKVRFIFRELPLEELAAAASMLTLCGGGDKPFALAGDLVRPADLHKRSRPPRPADSVSRPMRRFPDSTRPAMAVDGVSDSVRG